MPRLPRPTDSELAILRVLWDRGPSTVRTVHEALAGARETGYTTTLKLMQIMVAKGLVRRNESERTHVYTARLTQDQTQRQLVADLVQRAFGGSAAALMQQALSAHPDWRSLGIGVVDAPDVIEMAESPASAVRRKPRSSVRVAADLVARRGAAALVSAGHTGATVLAAHAAGLTTVQTMRTYAATRRWYRDVRMVREAVEMAVEGCRSPQEDRFRLIWEYDARWGRPLINRSILDRDGRLVAVPDLFDPVRGVVGEYAGADHRDIDRHEADVDREAAVRRVGLEYVEVVGRDLGDRRRVIRRMNEAASRAGAHPWTWVLGPPLPSRYPRWSPSPRV